MCCPQKYMRVGQRDRGKVRPQTGAPPAYKSACVAKKTQVACEQLNETRGREVSATACLLWTEAWRTAGVQIRVRG